MAAILQGAAWQRCRVHLRGALALVPKNAQQMVAATLVVLYFKVALISNDPDEVRLHPTPAGQFRLLRAISTGAILGEPIALVGRSPVIGPLERAEHVRRFRTLDTFELRQLLG
jgi:hypothetical protein